MTPWELANICRDCRTALRGKQLEAKRDEQEDKQAQIAVKQVLAMVRGNKLSAPHVTELVSGMMDRFGGLEQFTVAWKSQLDVAIAEKPGGKTVLDHFGILGKLIVESTKYRGSAPDLTNMTPEQLWEVIQSLGPKLFKPKEDEQATAGNAATA